MSICYNKYGSILAQFYKEEIYMINTRKEAMDLTRTNPYPDTFNGKTKVREEVWINGLYGLPCKEDALHQMRKNISDYEYTIKGFYCSGGIHTGAFCEYDPIKGYGKEGICWKYYFHYAVYR